MLKKLALAAVLAVGGLSLAVAGPIKGPIKGPVGGPIKLPIPVGGPGGPGFGGPHFHHGGHFWGGRFWGYGIGPCWRLDPYGEFVWVCY